MFPEEDPELPLYQKSGSLQNTTTGSVVAKGLREIEVVSCCYCLMVYYITIG
jgi:hypothetical protein